MSADSIISIKYSNISRIILLKFNYLMKLSILTVVFILINSNNHSKNKSYENIAPKGWLHV
jgi:hypothetical protein